MKIAVTGAYDSRKKGVYSSLFLYLNVYKGIPKEHMRSIDVIKTLQEQGLEFGDKTTFLKQEGIFNFQETREVLAEIDMSDKKFEHLLLNKTIFDVYVYTEFKFPDEAKRFLYGELRKWIPRHPYNFLVKVPVFENGLQNNDNQQKMDQRLEEILKEMEVSFLKLEKNFFQQNTKEHSRIFEEYFGKQLK